MNEYQIVVGCDGQFLFRTDWDHRQDRVLSAVKALQATGLQIEVMARAPVTRRVTDLFIPAEPL